MILVLLGTQNNNFHRLLDEVEKNIEKGKIKEEVIVQAGFTKYKTDKMKIFDMIPQEELDNLKEKARIVITHGGVASIVSSLKLKKKVIAVPRLKKYNEHVNDHQKKIIKNFNDKGYIIGIEDVSELRSALDKIEEFEPQPYQSNTEKIIQMIDDFILKI